MLLKKKLVILIITLLLLVFGFFIQSDYVFSKSENKRIQNEVIIFTQMLIPYYLNGDLDQLCRIGLSFGYMQISSIPAYAKILYENDNDMIYFKIFSYDNLIGFSLHFLEDSEDSVVFVKPLDDNIWNKYKIFILIFQIVIVLFLTFFVFNQIFLPLDKLHKAISKFKSGIYTNIIKVDSDNEIGVLMKAFNEMSEKISRMIRSRELITRNIAHELKTTLAKIKLALSLKQGDELKRDLNTYVDYLRYIIDTMIEYEHIQEDGFILKQEICMSESVLLEALKNFQEGEEISLTIHKNVQVKCDIYLLSVAIKNLIENAIKYSSDGKVDITLNEDGIMFSNKGKALDNDISYYFEPFYRGEVAKNGYGLGLSIVNEIISLHSMNIDYCYSNGMHTFYIRF